MHGLHQNYDPYYTLHYSVSFIVKLNGNMKHMTYMCVLLKWYKFKKPRALFSESIKNKTFFKISLMCVSAPPQNPCNPKFPNRNQLCHHHYDK